jgi:hypothetical protein
MSVGDLKNTVRRGIEASGKSLSTMQQVAADLKAATAAARGVLHDTRDEAVVEGLAHLDEAGDEVELTTRRLWRSADHAHGFLAAI